MKEELNLRSVLLEAAFYSIDLDEALCPIKEGLYVSVKGKSDLSSHHPWIVNIEKCYEFQAQPPTISITGVIEEREA